MPTWLFENMYLPRSSFLVATAVATLMSTAPARSQPAPKTVNATHHYSVAWPQRLAAVQLPPSTTKPGVYSDWATVLTEIRRGDDGTVATITRMPVPGRKARRDSDGWFAAIEASVRNSTPRYRRRALKTSRLLRYPVLDLTFDSGSKARARVYTRWIWFRSFTLVLAISVPAKHVRRRSSEARALLKSFRPHLQ